MPCFNLDAAKIALMSDPEHTFITSVLLSLHYVEDPDIGTAATDGKHIKYNSDFMDSLSREEAKGLLLHESWHVAFNHTGRREDRDPDIWNMAADHAINLMLQAEGITLPSGALADSRFTGMSTEQIYDQLYEENPNQEHPDPDVLPPEGTPEEQEQQYKEIILKAHTLAEIQKGEKEGILPPEMERLLDELTNPVLDWRTLLQSYMNRFVREGFSWSKPNRRFLPTYLPSRRSLGMGNIGVYIDVSGSVTDESFIHLLTEAIAIKDTLNPSKITFTGFNTELTESKEFTRDEPIVPFTFQGYGGTSIYPVLDDIVKQNNEISLIFTDGHFEDPYPITQNVIWLIYGNPNFTCDFGTIIHYPEEK